MVVLELDKKNLTFPTVRLEIINKLTIKRKFLRNLRSIHCPLSQKNITCSISNNMKWAKLKINMEIFYYQISHSNKTPNFTLQIV